MESFGKCLAVILAVLLLILTPVRILMQVQTGTEDSWYQGRAKEFVEIADRQGYLTRGQYEQFVNAVSAGGAQWEIGLTHARQKTGVQDASNDRELKVLSTDSAEPAHILKSAKMRGSVPAFSREQANTREKVQTQGQVNTQEHVHTPDCYTHTHTEKTDSKNGKYYCTHTHTADCRNDGWTNIYFVTCARCSLTCELYMYTYDKNGRLEYSTPLYLPSGGRCPLCSGALSSIRYDFTVYYSCGYSASQESSVNSVPGSIKKPVPGTVQSGWFQSPLDGYEFGCYRYSVHNHETENCGRYLLRKVIPVLCNTCGGTCGAVIWEYNRDGSVKEIFRPTDVYVCCGNGSRAREDKSVFEYQYLCGKTSGWEFVCQKELEASVPVCDRVILNVKAGKPDQTVYTGDEIDTSLSVSYLNGSNGTVQGNTAFSADKPGTFTAQVSITGDIGSAGNPGIASDSVRVTVMPREKKCRNGHTYTLNADGSDPGCPVCKVTVYELKVILKTNVIYKGDAVPVQKVTAYYLDGHTQELTSGWEAEYDRGKTGSVPINFKYRNVSCTVTLTVKPNITGIKVLPENQNIVKYEKAGFLVTVLYEDGTAKAASDYQISGIAEDRVGVQRGTISYTENNRKAEAAVTVTVLPLSASCAYGHTYDRDAADVSWGCPVCRETLTAIEACPAEYHGRMGDELKLTVLALYQDGHTAEVTSYESNYRPDLAGEQRVTIRYGGKETAVTAVLNEYILCPECGNEFEAGSICPYCRNRIAGLFVSPESQSIEYGQYPEFLAAFVYGDGHKEPASGYMTDFREGVSGGQTVTIYCGGFTAHAFVEVHALPEAEMPVDLLRISAEPADGPQVKKGEALKLRVHLYYSNGEQEIIYSGYTVKNYDPMKTGTQKIEVWYEEKSAQVILEVTEALTQTCCDNGHFYFLNPDGSDPGCPVCTGTGLFDTSDFLDIYYSPQILGELEETGIYRMEEGDYFSVRLTRKRKSFAQKILSLLGSDKGGGGEIIYSGMITGRGEENQGV